MSKVPRYRIALRRSERGFTLLEILVAFVLLAIGLGTASAGIGLAVRSDVRAQAIQDALLVAQSRLDAAGLVDPLVPGRSEGVTQGKYRWSQTVVEVRPATMPANANQPRPATGGLRAFWVTVAVEAASGSTTRLSALKIATETKP
jgi:general secretion pathway protein I